MDPVPHIDPPAMSLREAFADRRFVVTAELSPPRDPDPEGIRRKARALAEVVRFVNVTDNPTATVKVSPLAASVLVLESGLTPILQVTSRDRNLLALQADLLGCWMLGVRDVLALSGDPLAIGAYAGVASVVNDVDSLGLISLIAAMNAGNLAAGEPLSTPTGFLIGAATNPFVDSVERLEAKLGAGAAFFQTNIVYDVDRFIQWLAPVVAAGITERAPLLVGVAPPRSTGMLERLHREIPGVEVNPATFARLAGLHGEEARDAGIELAIALIDRLRSVSGVAGVHLMAFGWEEEAITRLVKGAGIARS